MHDNPLRPPPPNEHRLHKVEDEYFVRHDAELIKALRAKLDAERLARERSSHHMRCPSCGATLSERQFHHMKIHVCPECGGSWLDKGELEMLVHVRRGSLNRFIDDLLGLSER